jgi:hypothetical protein
MLRLESTSDPHPTIFIPKGIRFRHRWEISHFPRVGTQVLVRVDRHRMKVKIGSANLNVPRSFYNISRSAPTIYISDNTTHSTKDAWTANA